MEDAKRLTESLMNPTEKFNSEMEKSVGLYNAGRIVLETLSRALAKYQDDLPMTKLLVEQNSAADDAYFAKQLADIGYSNEMIKQEIELYHQLNAAKKANPDLPVGKVIDATASKIGSQNVVADLTSNDAANKSLKEYDDLLKKIDDSATKAGASNRAIFDGALGGINLMIGAFDDLSAKMDENTKSQLKLNDLRGKGINVTQGQAALDNKNIKDTLSGTRQVIGATAQMFDKKSSAAKALHVIEQGIGAAELAMTAMKTASNIASMGPAVATGVAQLFSQGGWVGFAGAAAFLALMAGLGFSGGGGGGGNVSLPSATTGTVLGDSSKSSESIKNITDTLNGIHASEYRELRGINSSMAALNANITKAVASIFQAGGLQPSGPFGKQNHITLGLKGTGDKYVDGFLDTIKMALGISAIESIIGGTKTSLKELGIATQATRLNDIATQGVNPQQYQVNHVKESSFFGLITTDSYDKSPEYSALNERITFTINAIFKNAADAFQQGSKVFGGMFDKNINDYILPALQIDLKDLKGEDAIKRLSDTINAALDNAGDALFPELKIYKDIGEGMDQTYFRLVQDVAVFKDSMAMAGKPVIDVSLDTIAFAEALVSASGDLKTLRTNFEDFFSKFFTEGQQFGYHGTNIIATLSGIGKTMPATREAWAEMVQASLDGGTAFADTSAQLLALTGSADEYYNYLQKATDIFINLGEQLKGKEWGASVNKLIATDKTDTAINKFNSAAGTKFDRGTIKDIYSDNNKILGTYDFAKANPLLGGLIADAFKAFNEELTATTSLTQIQTDAQDKAKKTTEDLTTKLKALADAQKSVTDRLKELGSTEVQNGLTAIDKKIAGMIKAASDNGGTLTNTDELRAAEVKNYFKPITEEFNNIGKGDYQKSLKGITQWADDMVAVAPEIALAYNTSTREAIESINAVKDARLAALNKEREQTIKDAQDTYAALQTSNLYQKLGINDLESQLMGISKSFVDMITKVAEQGKGLNDGAQLVNLALQTGADAFAKASKTLQDNFKQIQKTIGGQHNSIADKITSLTNPSGLAQQQFLRAVAQLNTAATTLDYQSQIDAIKTIQDLSVARYDAEIAKIKQLSDFIYQFQISKLGTLSPEAKLAKTQDKWNEKIAFALANKNDANAVNEATSAFNDYAQSANDYYASTEPYQKIIADNLDKIKSLGADGSVKDKQTQIANYTAETVAQLRSLDGTLREIEQQQTNKLSSDLMVLQASTEKVGQDFMAAIYALGAKYNVNPGQINTSMGQQAGLSLRAQDPPGKLPTPGMDAFDRGEKQLAAHYATLSGLFSASEIDGFLAQSDAGQAQIIADLKRQGKTFATGGSYPGGLALVGEQGPEFINFDKPGQVYTAPQTRAIMQGGDNSDLIAEIKQLREDNAQLQQTIISVLQDGFVQTVGENKKQSRSLDDMQRKQRIAENA